MKKCLFILLALTGMIAGYASTLVGDVNGDGTVDVADISYILTVMAGDAESGASASGAADVNGDGTVDVADISSVMTIMAGNSTQAEGDSTVTVVYSDDGVTVTVADNVRQLLDVITDGAHVTITPSDDLDFEVTYRLSGSSVNGSFNLGGSYKASIDLAGLTLTNPSGAPINISNGKRISLSAKKDTENTLTDGAEGSHKAAIYCKGHLELKGKGTLNVHGNAAHAIKSGDYMSMRNCTVNILSAAKDGISCNEFFLMESGTLNISGVGDDGIQCDLDGDESTGETADHEDEDTGNIYIEDGTMNITVSADGAKGMKAAGDVRMSGGKVSVTQTGSIVAGEDLSYPTSIKADGNISITGGNIIIDNSADGGKGMSADGSVTIDETKAAVTIDIAANGKGGIAELTGTGEGQEETQKSYKVYVSIPTSGGGGGPGGGSRVWTTVYLYKSDGTLVQTLSSTVTLQGTTFYYYDFKEATEGTYYFKSNNYTSGGGGGGTTYTIITETFSAPTSGENVYYSITNSYTTSGNTRTYKLTNVTSTYGGSSDVSEDNGTSYNAIGIKADGNLTIGGGTITVKNSGAMSKSMKSKATLTIDGGTITLTPSGTMQVVNSDPSYSSAIKAVDYVQNGGNVTIKASGQAGRGVTANTITTNGGTLDINNSGAGVKGSSDDYTAKGLKADTSIKLNGGTVNINMTGTGGKGMKCKGTYTQGTTEGNGPTLTVSTSGSKLNASSGGGGGPGWPGGWGEQSGGGSAKAIKVQGTIYLYGGTSEVSTKTDGAEGLESKTAIYVEGGQHYFLCYDDCMNSSGAIYFNGGATVCYSNGNDAVDSNYGRTGAITIGNGAVLAYTTRGAPEEGLDCDNVSYIQIKGNGYAVSAGGAQGGGGGSSSTISNATQGYKFLTSTISYATNRYYTLSDSDGNNLMTYSLPTSISSTLSLFTAKGMVSGSKYYLKSSTTTPADATTVWHGLYLGSSHKGDTSVTEFTAQ